MVWKKRHPCSPSRSAAGSGVRVRLRAPRRDGDGQNREARRRSGAPRTGQPVPVHRPGPVRRRQPSRWSRDPLRRGRSEPGGTGHSCWDGKGKWSGWESPDPRPDSRTGCLPAHPTGGEAVPVPPRSSQPRTEPCPLLGLAQCRAQPVAIAGVRKTLQSGGSCARPAARAHLCAQVPRGIGCAALRGPCSLARRYAPSPQCAGPVRSRCTAARGVLYPAWKTSAAPHFPQCHGSSLVPSYPKSRAEP